MKPRTRSILDELNSIGIKRDTNYLIESKGSNIIESAINLLATINESYDTDTALELERRFISSIKTNDPKKFKRAMSKIIASKETPTK